MAWRSGNRTTCRSNPRLVPFCCSLVHRPSQTTYFTAVGKNCRVPYSLVHGPSQTASFTDVEKSIGYCSTAAKKNCLGRPGYVARYMAHTTHTQQSGEDHAELVVRQEDKNAL